jgi:hypothetical protein
VLDALCTTARRKWSAIWPSAALSAMTNSVDPCLNGLVYVSVMTEDKGSYPSVLVAGDQRNKVKVVKMQDKRIP